MAGLGLAILLIATVQTIGTQAQTSSNFIFNPILNMVSKAIICHLVCLTLKFWRKGRHPFELKSYCFRIQRLQTFEIVTLKLSNEIVLCSSKVCF
jgi:hypothetical protein